MLSTELKKIDLVGSVTTYYETGQTNSQTVVLVHGFRGDHHGLLKIASHMQDFRILIPDLPGFGESTPLLGEHNLDNLSDWLVEFCENVAGEKYFLVAHSFGTLVTARALSRGLSPEKVSLINPISSLALSGPNRIMTRLATFYYFLSSIASRRISSALLKNALIVRLMSIFMTKSKNKELRTWIHREHDQYFSNFSDPKSLLESFKASTSASVAGESSSFSTPTLIVVGELDDLTPLNKQLELNHQIAGSKLVILSGTGHLIHYEEDLKAAELIKCFFAEE